MNKFTPWVHLLKVNSKIYKNKLLVIVYMFAICCRCNTWEGERFWQLWHLKNIKVGLYYSNLVRKINTKQQLNNMEWRHMSLLRQLLAREHGSLVFRHRQMEVVFHTIAFEGSIFASDNNIPSVTFVYWFDKLWYKSAVFGQFKFCGTLLL